MSAKIALLPSHRRQAEEALFDTGAYIRCIYWNPSILRAEICTKCAERGAARVVCSGCRQTGHYWQRDKQNLLGFAGLLYFLKADLAHFKADFAVVQNYTCEPP